MSQPGAPGSWQRAPRPQPWSGCSWGRFLAAPGCQLTDIYGMEQSVSGRMSRWPETQEQEDLNRTFHLLYEKQV